MIICLVLCWSCHENRPEYQLIGSISGERTILVEEFSGARCPNCPQGTQELANLKSIYKERLVIVTIHAGDFAFKYDDSRYDFTTAEGNSLLEFLGNPIGYPSAVINRTIPAGQADFQTFSSKWSTAISEEAAKPRQLRIDILLDYDADTRNLSIDVEISALEDLDLPTRLTVLIKEDHIVDPQADRAAEQGIVKDYNHVHVLRRILTDFQGDPLANALSAFQPIQRTFSIDLPAEDGWWKADDLTVVAFVSIDAVENVSVVEATEAAMKP